MSATLTLAVVERLPGVGVRESDVVGGGDTRRLVIDPVAAWLPDDMSGSPLDPPVTFPLCRDEIVDLSENGWSYRASQLDGGPGVGTPLIEAWRHSEPSIGYPRAARDGHRLDERTRPWTLVLGGVVGGTIPDGRRTRTALLPNLVQVNVGGTDVGGCVLPVAATSVSVKESSRV